MGKRRWEERPALEDYHREKEERAQRARAKNLAMPLHLRTGTNAVDMGCPITYLTQMQRSLSLPIKMAVDPKWSTELKRINDKVGARIEHNRMLSASVPGQMSPEAPYMHPKR